VTDEIQEEVVEIVDSPEETTARQGGWCNEAEWVDQGKDPKDWRSAELFNERGELYRKTSNQAKEIRRIKEDMESLKAHHKKVDEIAYDRAVKDLEARKLDALNEGRNEEVIDIERQIREAEKATAEADTTNRQPSNPGEAAAQAWVGRNTWYEQNPALAGQANAIMADYRGKNPYAEIEDVFDYTEKEIKKHNPAIFGRKEVGTPKVGSGGGGQPQSGKSKYPSLSELPKMEQDVVNTFAAKYGMKVDDYIKEAVDTGGIQWNK